MEQAHASEVRPIVVGYRKERGSWAGAVGLWLTMVWFGFVAGWLELAFVLVQGAVAPRVTLNEIRTSRYFMWMIPASDVLLFAVAGLVVAAVSLFRPKFARQACFATAIWLSALAVLLNIQGLYLIAVMVLAGGIASVSATVLERLWARMGKALAWSAAAMALGLVVLCGVVTQRVATAEARALAACPPARRGDPNVLLIVLDTVRATCLSLYGHYRPTTPNLERLGAMGLVFEQARSTSSWTAPTHATLMTGYWPHQLSAGMYHPLDATYPTLAEVLAKQGYATAGIVGNYYYCNSIYGFNRGFAHYEDAYENQTISLYEIVWSSRLGKRVIQALGFPTDLPEGNVLLRKTAAMINRDALAWIDHRPADRPFFLFLNYYDAHQPYEVPRDRRLRFGLATLPRARQYEMLKKYENIAKNHQLPPDLDRIKAETLDLLHDAYDSCIAYLDEQLGEFLGALEARDLLDNALIVVTSDHGEQMGEHGLVNHGTSVYSSEVHVPLVIVPPATQRGVRRVARPVSLREVPATIAGYVGLGGDNPFPGRSLTRFLDLNRRRRPELSPVFCEIQECIAFIGFTTIPPQLGPARSLVSREGIYIRKDNGTEELYNLWTDPTETTNLAADPGMKPLLDRFRNRLEQISGEQGGGM